MPISDVRPVLGGPPTGAVVMAPDKFKGSLSALEVAEHLRSGFQRRDPTADVVVLPIADGGQGTVESAIASGFGRRVVRVAGPLGGELDAILAVSGGVAVVELAQASGLDLMPVLDRRPLAASSRGTGQLIRAALDAGCRTVILGLGGSASTDGGAGMLQALGVRLLDRHAAELQPGGGALLELQAIDLSGLDPRLARTKFIIAGDVDNPLLGPDGAAAVFAPQKGATSDDVHLLEVALTRWAAAVASTLGHDFAATPGAGAAGGVGFAARALLGGQFRPGVEVVLEMVNFDQRVAQARLVITGEGSLDEQTLRGKAPLGVARAAAKLHIPVIAVAGRTTLGPGELARAGFRACYTLQRLEPNLELSLRDAAALLQRIGSRIAGDVDALTLPD